MDNNYVDDSRLIEPLTYSDFSNNRDLVIALAAESSDPKTVGRKLEILLGKRTKSTEYLEVEEMLNYYIKRIYDTALQLIAERKYYGDTSKVTLMDYLESDESDKVFDEHLEILNHLKERAEKVGLYHTKIFDKIYDDFISSLRNKW